MSRIGKLPVPLEKGVKATLGGDKLRLEGPKGQLETRVHPGFVIDINDSTIVVKRPGDTPSDRAVHGLMRKLVANMAEGVSKGFKTVLEINGVGYRAEVKGRSIQLALGYSHPIVFALPDGVEAKIDKQTVITLEGADRQVLGETAAATVPVFFTCPRTSWASVDAASRVVPVSSEMT